jgi:hypothetical protein
MAEPQTCGYLFSLLLRCFRILIDRPEQTIVAAEICSSFVSLHYSSRHDPAGFVMISLVQHPKAVHLACTILCVIITIEREFASVSMVVSVGVP